MYCPRCDRTIKKEKFENINKQLKERFQVDSLEKGTCPVCKGPLVDISKIKGEKK